MKLEYSDKRRRNNYPFARVSAEPLPAMVHPSRRYFMEERDWAVVVDAVCRELVSTAFPDKQGKNRKFSLFRVPNP
jgi:hypothetical protein